MKDRERDRRIIVIGGGPAGAVCALHLARAGVQVTLLERSVFPRTKVCGECVSPSATGLLETVIGRGDLLAAGARRVDRFVMELGERTLEFGLPREAWALSRGTLDAMLIASAAAAGAQVEQPAVVRDVEYRDDVVSVVLTDGRRVEGDFVVHADGSGRFDPAGPVATDPRLLGMKCHLDARLTGTIDGVRIRVCAGAYIGTIEVEGGLATCAMTARQDLVKAERGNTDAVLEKLWPAYRPEWRVGDWKTCGLARNGYVKSGHWRSVRIGNAAAAVDPIGGEGIGLALWSGTEAARELATLDPCRADAPGVARMHARLERAYRSRLRSRLPACRIAAACLMSPGLVHAAWPLLGMSQWSMKPWFVLTGKTT